MSNKLFIGPPATGKTQALKEELARSILSGKSVLVADPSGELYNFAESLGDVETRVFNLKDITTSDKWIGKCLGVLSVLYLH